MSRGGGKGGGRWLVQGGSAIREADQKKKSPRPEKQHGEGLSRVKGENEMANSTKTTEVRTMKRTHSTSKQVAIILAVGLAALEAWGGKLGILAKIAGHGADNAAAHMMERGADEAAEAAARGAVKGAAKSAAGGKAMGEALERALQTASGKPRSHAPTMVLAAGVAVAAVDAAHNFSSGSRNRNESVGQAEGKAIEANPGLVVACRAQEHRWKNILAGGGAAALLALVLPTGLRGFRRKERRAANGEKSAVRSGNGDGGGLVQGGKEEPALRAGELSAESSAGQA